jgi:hypothetical protein
MKYSIHRAVLGLSALLILVVNCGAQVLSDPIGSKPLQMPKAELERRFKKLEGFAEKGGGIRDLVERLVEANDREDRGSVFFIGSLIVERVWKGLGSEIKRWAAKNPSVEKLDSDLFDALLELNHFTERLERLSVGPFLFDQKKEEAMVATTRDKVLLTKLVMRSFLEKNWREELPKLDIDFSLRSLFAEVVKLKRTVSDLGEEVRRLKDETRKKDKKDYPPFVLCNPTPMMWFEPPPCVGGPLFTRCGGQFR